MLDTPGALASWEGLNIETCLSGDVVYKHPVYHKLYINPKRSYPSQNPKFKAQCPLVLISADSDNVVRIWIPALIRSFTIHEVIV
jgi:hypothetical protein